MDPPMKLTNRSIDTRAVTTLTSTIKPQPPSLNRNAKTPSLAQAATTPPPPAHPFHPYPQCQSTMPHPETRPTHREERLTPRSRRTRIAVSPEGPRRIVKIGARRHSVQHRMNKKIGGRLAYLPSHQSEGAPLVVALALEPGAALAHPNLAADHPVERPPGHPRLGTARLVAGIDPAAAEPFDALGPHLAQLVERGDADRHLQ